MSVEQAKRCSAIASLLNNGGTILVLPVLVIIVALAASNQATAYDPPDPCDEDPCDEACISISLTANATVVAEGGSLNFTVTVDPGTDVDRVILSYEGESGQDEDSIVPYTFTHQFDNPMDDLTVTTTVKFTSEHVDCQRTLDVDVVGLAISNSGNPSPTRAASVTYTAQSNPAGKTIDQFNWTYSFEGGGSNTYQDNDSDGDELSNWFGKMVVGGTLTCSTTVSGVAVESSKTITIEPRNWPTPITCAQDNEAGWGDIPTPAIPLGENRDRDSNCGSYIFVPRDIGSDFAPARTLAQVESGPCEGLWYVSSSILMCQRETVINKHIKVGGGFYERNDGLCFDADDFLQAVKNHEYRGTPSAYKSIEGHQGRIENAIVDQSYDAKQHIEPLISDTSIDLSADVDLVISADENVVYTFCADHSYMETYGPNWGSDPESLGYGQNSRWDEPSQQWSFCIWGPDEF